MKVGMQMVTGSVPVLLAIAALAARPADASATGIQTISPTEYSVSLEIPASWNPVQGRQQRYGGADGWVQVSAAEGKTLDDICSGEAHHKLQPYGSNPTVRKLQVRRQPACLIQPSKDQSKDNEDQAGLIVTYPRPVTIRNDTYRFLVVWGDKQHLEEITKTVRFP